MDDPTFTESQEVELERVLKNPDNFIMSESLEDLLDHSQFVEAEEIWSSGDYACDFKFDHGMLTGVLQSFQCQPKQKIISVMTDKQSAIMLMKDTRLLSFECRTVEGHTVILEDLEQDVSASVQFIEGEEALVFITINNLEDK